MGEQQIEHRKSRSVFPRTFPSSTVVPVLLLNQPNKESQQISYNFFQYTTSFFLPFYSMDTGVLLSFLSLLILLSVIILVVIVIIIIVIIIIIIIIIIILL